MLIISGTLINIIAANINYIRNSNFILLSICIGKGITKTIKLAKAIKLAKVIKLAI